jgi:predicted aspartyl protease
MGYRSAVVTAVASAALLFGGHAQAAPAAQACSLKSVDVPLAMHGLRPLVEAKINGKPVTFLLDSGSFYNLVSAKFAAEQKMKTAQRAVLGTRFKSAAETYTNGAAGEETTNGLVVASTFEFGAGKFDTVGFITTPGLDGEHVQGIIGQNFLHQMDNEFDLKDGLMRFVRPQGCEAVDLAYWVKAPSTYSMLPLVTTDRINRHTVAMVEINGEKMRAIFDTGAERSFITRRAAGRAGVKTTDAGVTYIGHSAGLDRDDIDTWIAPFASIKIGDEEIRNTKLAIGASNATSDDFDVLIGADFFLAHHVYVANSQGKMYFSYSGGPVFNLHPEAASASQGEGHPTK